MKNLDQEELEKFIRDNKDRFDIYEPESDHNQHFLNKLINKFKEVINIVPYLVKVGLATILVFIISFFIWRAYICPPLTRISLKYWKAERDYRYQIHRNTRLTNNYIYNSEEKTKFKLELQKYDDSYEVLKKRLRENASVDNISNMLRLYQEELLKSEENLQNYTNKKSQSD